MKLLFAACGSIGHIAPCIAVWRAVQTIEPAAEAHVICSTRPEDQTFLQKEGMTFTALGERNVRVWTLPVMFLRAWRLLGHVKPDVIFTKGGGVTIPVALAGWIRRIPIVVHESDAIAGRATRFIAHVATVVCYGFPNEVASCELRVAGTRNPKPETRNHFTGNPTRPEVMQGSRERGLALTGLSGSRPILLVTGGSQGAQVFNDVIIRHIDELLHCVDIIHIMGEGKNGVKEKKNGYWKIPFVHEDLHHLYAIADMALSRAGSGTIGELAANGIPAILVPLEGLAQNHQVKNAEIAALTGGCILLQQASLDTEFTAIVRNLAEHGDVRRKMSEEIRTLHKDDTAVAVAKILLAVICDRGAVT